MPPAQPNHSLLLELQGKLSADLFARAAPLRLAADEALFLAGDGGDGCYLVEEGLLKVAVASQSGGERILAFLGPGAIVGEMSIIDGRPRSSSVVAVRQAALKFLSRAAFEEFTRNYPEVYKYLVKLLASRLREANAVIAAGTFLSLKGRVARTLLELAEGFGQDVGSGRIVIHQKIGQSDLAARAGIARANVSRILNEWKRHKLVSRLSGYYCLKNKARLKANPSCKGDSAWTLPRQNLDFPTFTRANRCSQKVKMNAPSELNIATMMAQYGSETTRSPCHTPARPNAQAPMNSYEDEASRALYSCARTSVVTR